MYRMRGSGPKFTRLCYGCHNGKRNSYAAYTIMLVVFLDRDSAAFENHNASCNTGIGPIGKSVTVAEHLVAAMQVRKESDKTWYVQSESLNPLIPQANGLLIMCCHGHPRLCCLRTHRLQVRDKGLILPCQRALCAIVSNCDWFKSTATLSILQVISPLTQSYRNQHQTPSSLELKTIQQSDKLSTEYKQNYVTSTSRQY